MINYHETGWGIHRNLYVTEGNNIAFKPSGEEEAAAIKSYPWLVGWFISQFKNSVIEVETGVDTSCFVDKKSYEDWLKRAEIVIDKGEKLTLENMVKNAKEALNKKDLRHELPHSIPGAISAIRSRKEIASSSLRTTGKAQTTMPAIEEDKSQKKEQALSSVPNQVTEKIKEASEKTQNIPRKPYVAEPETQLPPESEELGIKSYHNNELEWLPENLKTVSTLNISNCNNLKGIKNIEVERDMYLTDCPAAEFVSHVKIGKNGVFRNSGLKYVSDVTVEKYSLKLSDNKNLESLTRVTVAEDLHLDNCTNLKTLNDVKVGRDVHLEGCINIDKENLIQWVTLLSPPKEHPREIYLDRIPFSVEELNKLRKIESDTFNLSIKTDYDKYFEVRDNLSDSESSDTESKEYFDIDSSAEWSDDEK